MTVSEHNGVQVIEGLPLHCKDQTATDALPSVWPLGPMDHLVYPSLPIEVVFVYKTPRSTSPSPSHQREILPLPRLRKALSRLLDYYPHLTGRLQFNPDSRAAEIHQIGTGAELLVARSAKRLDDLTAGRANGRILITDLPDCGNALTPPFDPRIQAVCRDPIFTIQHTRFACGGVALGIRLHHIVCDASGFFQLVRDLASIYRGLDGPELPVLACPSEIRSYLREPLPMSCEERKDALKSQPSMFHLGDNDTEIPISQSHITPRVTGRVLRFSGRALKHLKELATDPKGETWVSTFEALSAYLYQHIYRARVQLLRSQGIPEFQVPSHLSRGFWSCVDLRRADRLNLSQQYFPNGVVPMILHDLPHELLTESPLWEVSSALHHVIRSFNYEQIKQDIKWVAFQPDKSRIKVTFNFGGANISVSQWSKHDMYCGVDFDLDEDGNAIPPTLVSSPISRADGLAMILSTEEQVTRSAGKGKSLEMPCSIDVNLTLVEELWPILDADEQFRKYCC